MQRPPLVVAGRAADRLTRLSSQSGEDPCSKPYHSKQESLRGTLHVSVISCLDDLQGALSRVDLTRDPVPDDVGLVGEVLMTPETLVQEGIIHRSLVQVANPARPNAGPRLAVALAAQSLWRSNSNKDQSESGWPRHNGSAGETISASRDLSSPREKHSLKHGVAYLSPMLAHNLGYSPQLAPFLRGPTAKKGLSKYEPGIASTSTWSWPAHGMVEIKPLIKGLPKTAEDISFRGLQQPGRLDVHLPVAKSLVLAKLRFAEVAPLPPPEKMQALAKAAHGQGDLSGARELPEGDGGGDNQGTGATPAPPEPEAAAAVDHLVASLQDYFSSGLRLLAKGDVIAVQLPEESGCAFLLNSLYGCMAGAEGPERLQHLAFLKVVDIQPDRPGCFVVDQNITTMSLQGTACGAIPVGITPNAARAAASEPSGEGHVNGVPQPPTTSLQPLGLGRDIGAAWLEPAFLPGTGPLLPAWRQLASIIAPVMHQGAANAGVRVAVLITGPEGSGRTTAVKAAAAALGLQLLPFSALEVRGAGRGEAHVAAALRSAFRASSDYAPAILLLTQAESLAEVPPGQAPGARESSAVRLAAVLSEFITAGSSPSAHLDSVSPASPPAMPQEAGRVSGSNPAEVVAEKKSPHFSQAWPGPVVLVACAASAEQVPTPLRRCFTHELAVDAPDEKLRLELLQGMLWDAAHPDVMQSELSEAAAQTAGMLPTDLAAIAADATAAAAVEAVDAEALLFQGPHTSAKARTAAAGATQNEAASVGVSGRHLQDALQLVRKRTATAIGAPQVPNVKWADVGGLEDVKSAILETVELPLQHPHLFAAGLRRRSGVLLYGPPGTGKTLVAKAVATECSLNFLSVKGPELINMYIGESERQVREVFARARRARPCVLFFDELDSLAPARGVAGDSGGVMDRIVAQLLAEIDGLQSSAGPSTTNQDVFVIGATNRPDLLDPALLRPGRLDKLLYVGVAEDAESKVKVLKALTRKFCLSEGVDLVKVAHECAPTFTGADLYALCADAWMNALRRTAHELQGGRDGGNEGEEDVLVEPADFWDALRELRPSLSREELARYQALRMQYEGRK
eukprot:jgi/Botrbrau1/11485/Bobra.0360s0012.1